MADDGRALDVYFDYVSPFAYVAAEILPAFARRHDLALRWTPIALHALASFEGGLPYSPAKRAYVAVDARRTAQMHGVAIEVPKPFPVESGEALRLAWAARDDACFPRLHAALFRAAWRERRDLAAPEVRAACLDEAGGDRRRLADADRPETAERLAAETRRAEARGVFGVPTFAWEDELFWGVDALPTLEWRLGAGAVW